MKEVLVCAETERDEKKITEVAELLSAKSLKLLHSIECKDEKIKFVIAIDHGLEHCFLAARAQGFYEDSVDFEVYFDWFSVLEAGRIDKERRRVRKKRRTKRPALALI